MGEFDFIDNIRRSFEGIGNDAITGIGDDCAVIPVSATESLVVTTDMLVEGVHFLRHATSARELGGKSLAVSLSDIAAMGAHPIASFLSIALPGECRCGGNAHGGEWADEFMQGYREVSAHYNVNLAGGDTTGSAAGVAINVTIIGRAPNNNLKFRNGARPGDIVAVCGPLGESAAGLRDILDGHLDTPFARIHRNPTPQVEEGEWLGGRPQVHSMIDLSDGLASDLLHILRASGVGAQIDLEKIQTPVPIEFAVTGGEDYKLLFTVSKEGWDALRDDYLKRFGTYLHPIGTIISGAPGIIWMENCAPVIKNWRGFTHF